RLPLRAQQRHEQPRRPGLFRSPSVAQRQKHMRKIDIFNHIYPAGYYERLMKVAPDYKDIGKRMRGIPMLADLDVRFKVMDRFGEYEQVLSLPTPPIEVFTSRADATG